LKNRVSPISKVNRMRGVLSVVRAACAPRGLYDSAQGFNRTPHPSRPRPFFGWLVQANLSPIACSTPYRQPRTKDEDDDEEVVATLG
jgi:hypothetical protein